MLATAGDEVFRPVRLKFSESRNEAERVIGQADGILENPAGLPSGTFGF